MPVNLFVGALDLFLSAMRDFQTTYDKTTETLITGAADMAGAGTSAASPRDPAMPYSQPIVDDFSSSPCPLSDSPEQLADVSQTPSPSIRKEQNVSDWNCETDLNNDDLKSVNYTIIFTKRDFEATLQTEQQEQVYWATRLGGFAALKISDFLSQLNRGLDLPFEWRDGNHPPGDYGYNNSTSPTKYRAIPQVDRKYIDIDIKITDRRTRTEPEYDKDQARAQQQMADNIQRLADHL
jgi:hypothetical protein